MADQKSICPQPSTIGAQNDSKMKADFSKKLLQHRHQWFSWGLKLTEKTTPNSSFCIMLPSSKVKQPSALLNIRAILISQTSKKPHLIKISWSSWFSSGKPAQYINTHMYKYISLVVSTICFGGDHKTCTYKNEMCHNTLCITSYSHTYIHPLKGEYWLYNQSLHFTLFCKTFSTAIWEICYHILPSTLHSSWETGGLLYWVIIHVLCLSNVKIFKMHYWLSC